MAMPQESKESKESDQTNAELAQELLKQVKKSNLSEDFHKSICQLHGWQQPTITVEAFVAKTLKAYTSYSVLNHILPFLLGFTTHCANDTIKAQRIAALRGIVTKYSEQSNGFNTEIGKIITYIIEALTIQKSTADIEEVFWLQGLAENKYLNSISDAMKVKLHKLLSQRCKDDPYTEAHWLKKLRKLRESKNFFAQAWYLLAEEDTSYLAVLKDRFLSAYQSNPQYSELSQAYVWRKKGDYQQAIDCFTQALTKRPELLHIILAEIASCYIDQLENYSKQLKNYRGVKLEEVRAWFSSAIQHLQAAREAALSQPPTASKQLILSEVIARLRSLIINTFTNYPKVLSNKLFIPIRKDLNFFLGKCYLEEITISPFKKDVPTLVDFAGSAITIHDQLVRTTSRDNTLELTAAKKGRDEAIYQLALIFKDFPETIIGLLAQTHANTMSNPKGHRYSDFQLLLAEAYEKLIADDADNQELALKHYAKAVASLSAGTTPEQNAKLEELKAKIAELKKSLESRSAPLPNTQVTLAAISANQGAPKEKEPSPTAALPAGSPASVPSQGATPTDAAKPKPTPTQRLATLNFRN